MRFPLKYLVPSLVFIIGLLAMGINMYFYIDNEKTERITTAKDRALVIGNRMANEIEKRELYNKEDYADLTRMVSQYTLEYLNVMKIFNDKEEMTFQSVPVKFGTEFKHDISDAVRVVSKEVRSNISIDEKEVYVYVVVPLSMSQKETEVYGKKYGALYLQFDMSEIKAKSVDNIIKHGIHNGLVILLMVIVLAILIYFLILKPLTILHKTTTKMANGDLYVRLDVGGKNELGDLNFSFNEMAHKISLHQDELEDKIEEAVIKNTEQNRMMLQQGRLAAMGEMINNIAHQWRQPINTLAIILQKLEFFQKNGTLDEKKLKESIDKGMFLVNRMTTTIDDFRDFFVKSKEKKVFIIKELVEEAVALMDGTLKENNVLLTIDIEEQTQIKGYKNELMQVVLNIVNNAKDALVENRKENRKIDIRCIVKTEKMILEIKDNGGGIEEPVLDKIFDPYFSTKVEGKGSGIGLYMSKTIVEDNMDGKLEACNKEDGAMFSIILYIDKMHPFCDNKLK